MSVRAYKPSCDAQASYDPLMTPPDPASAPDLVIRGARCLATCDDERSEIAGGWIAVSDGRISALGGPGSEPAGSRVVDAADCLITPGLVNTHHHMYQNLTRAYGPALEGNLFHWLSTLYPKWARLDEESSYLSAWVGLAELALGGCTTTTDHLYVHPRGAGDLISAEITAAREVGMRFHPTRGSMSLSQKDGGLPPDNVVQEPDEILAECERLVGVHHDRSPRAMVRLALAPCSPFSVSPQLMRETAELAERLDVRLHTHLAEDLDEDDFCLEKFGRRPIELFEDVGWGTDRAWVAHCVQPNADEVDRLAAWGTGVSHCPSSNMILGAGIAPIADMRSAGVPVGLGCDGSASADSASMWTEARNALLLGRLRSGMQDRTPVGMRGRDALDMATRGGARCLGRDDEIGQLTVGACADIAVWPLGGVTFAGAISDPLEAWLRCGPARPRHTIVDGQFIVENGDLVPPGTEEILVRHRRAAEHMQA